MSSENVNEETLTQTDYTWGQLSSVPCGALVT